MTKLSKGLAAPLARDVRKENIATSSSIDSLCRYLAQKNFFMLRAEATREHLLARNQTALLDWEMFERSWSDLPLDTFMADGATYRRRRHTTLSARTGSPTFQLEPHEPHYQSTRYNPLNGGMARHFQAIDTAILYGHTMTSVINFGCELFGRVSPYADWHIEVHQFRIEVTGTETGLPTPEGVHRDGVSFAMMLMVARSNITGGSTTIYDLDDRRLDEFVLMDPLDLAVVNDERVRHGVAPVASLDGNTSGYRDVLVVTFRCKSA